MDLKEAHQLVDELEPKIERLKSLYQQYFMGIEKIPPHILRKDVERSIFRMRRSKIQNTRVRFKFQQLVQRYNTYDQYWGRIMRQIEKGTYKRDLRRAAKRFGQNEALEFAGRQGQAALKGLEEPEEEPQDVGPPVYELPDPDNFEIDLGFDEDDMPTPPSRRSPRPAPQAYHAQEVWDPGDLYSDRPPQSAPPSQPYAQPGHPPQPHYGDAVPAPLSTQPGYPPPPASQPRGRHPSQNAPAPLAGHPAQPAPGAPPARANRPRGGALFGGQRGRGSNAGAAPLPPGQPPAAPSPAAQRQPQPPRAPGPQLPHRPGAPPSRPPPPAPRRPGAPPQRPPPPAPGARSAPQRPAPAAPTPAPRGGQAGQRPQRPAAQHPQRPAAKRAGTEDGARAVYDEYMRARQRTGKGANVSYDAMRKSLQKQADQLRKRHGRNRKVDFEVVEKDGKPLIRPVVK